MAVTLVIGDDTGILYGVDDPKILAKLKFKMSYQVKGYQWTKLFKEGKWDGRRSLFWRNRFFPVGLTGLVAEILDKENVSYKVEDRRAKPEMGIPLEFRGEKRAYQKIEDSCIQATRGIINFATGGGKTAVAARIVGKLGLETLYVVPTKDLLYQVRDEMHAFLRVQVGIIGDDKNETNKPIVVGTVQSLSRGLKSTDSGKRQRIQSLLARKQVLFIDEAHHLGADSFYDVAKASKAYYKYGLTGTAFRADEAGILLRAATGKVIAKVSSTELIEAKVLSKPTVRMYEIWTHAYLGHDWRDVYWNGIVQNEVRNQKIASIVKELNDKGKTSLVLVKLLEHQHILHDLIPKSIIVHGKVDAEERDAIRQRFIKKEIQCLIATAIYDEGVNIPSVDAVVIATGGKSPVKSMQRVGRALRKTKTKKTVLVVDFKDMFNRTLLRHSKDRMDMYKTEAGFKLEEVPFEPGESSVTDEKRHIAM